MEKWLCIALAGEPSVEGIKVCQMACRSIGKAWRRRKGKPRGALRGKACLLSMCMSLPSLIDANTLAWMVVIA